MTKFDTYHGLCLNARNFSYFGSELRHEMQQQFKAAGLDDCYPFNEHIHYDDEVDTRLNPLRMAWVKDHIDNPPDSQSTRLIEFYQAWYEWATAI